MYDANDTASVLTRQRPTPAALTPRAKRAVCVLTPQVRQALGNIRAHVGIEDCWRVTGKAHDMKLIDAITITDAINYAILKLDAELHARAEFERARVTRHGVECDG